MDQNPSSWQHDEVLSQKRKEAFDGTADQIIEHYLNKFLAEKEEETKRNELQEKQKHRQSKASDVADETKEPSKQSNQRDQYKQVIESTNPWTLLEVYNAVESKELRQAEKGKASLSKKHMSQVLHEQIHEQQQIEQRHKLENQRYVELQTRQLQEWKQKMEELETVEWNEAQQLRNVRLDENEKEMQRRLNEKELSRKLELAVIEQCQKELQTEEQQRLQKKEQERQRFENVTHENVARGLELETRRNEEEAMNMKHVAVMKRRLDEEEARREAAFAERVARYEAFGKQMENNEEVKRSREMERKMEHKILRESREKEQRDMEREKRDLAELKRKRIAITRANKEMADGKHHAEMLAQEADKELSLQTRTESEAYFAQERITEIKERDRKKQYCMLLQNQVKN